jgi:hypothetical protein
MLVVDTANTAQAVNGILVVQMADQRVAGVRRQSDNATRVNDFRSLPDQTRLGIIRVNLKVLGHKNQTKATA